MTRINGDAIHGEDVGNLAHEDASCGVDAKELRHRVNVVRVKTRHVEELRERIKRGKRVRISSIGIDVEFQLAYQFKKGLIFRNK